MSIFNVTNRSNTAYEFSGSVVGLNPVLDLERNRTYQFNINALGHPFWIKTTPTTGSQDSYNLIVTNNGIDSGSILFTIPENAPDQLYYNSENSELLGGTINILQDPYSPFTGSFDTERFLDLYPSGSTDTVNLWISSSFVLVPSGSELVREEKWFWTGITIPSIYVQNDEYLDVILRQSQRIFLALPNPAPIPTPSPTPTPTITTTPTPTATLITTPTPSLNCSLAGFIDCSYCGLDGKVLCVEPILTCNMTGEILCL